MKPIMLKLAGLHSFREEQEIPFDKLSELGVFGIFGPTGSGKSSILDAMTLALYGTVVRAGRRTQGILNHAEKQVKVSFTFSLGQGRERSVYRVERRYARKDLLAVNNTHSRLIAVKDELEEVLADKDREVTDQITGLLGLKEEDFTRAVVLPQGKFADFLSLGGKERREMLQRLFSLEQYGNILINKVNDRVKIAETSYIEVESEQKGLGDASPTAIDNAQAALVLARQMEEQAVMAYKLAEEQYREAKVVYNLQGEAAKKQSELAGHRQHQGEIEQTAAALKMAERAERATLIAEEFSTSQNNEAIAVSAKQQAAEQANLLAAESKRLEAALNIARESRIKREPELIEQRTRLEAARKLEEQVTQMAAEVAVLVAQQQQQQIAATTASKELEQQAVLSQSLSERIKEFEHKVIGASISAERRAKVQECLVSAQALRQNMAAADKVKLAGVQRKQQFDTAEAAAKQAEETRRQVETRLGTLEAAEAQAAEAQLKAASAQLDQLLAGERLAAAARLAKELVDDAPCPVCGSCSHPHPATSGQSNDTGDLTHFEQEIAAVKEHIANLTQSLAEISKAVAAERQLLVEVGASSAGLSQQAATALAELETVRAEYIEARAAVNRVCEQLIQALHMAGQTLTGNLTADSALKQVRELTESINIQDTLAETLNKQLVSHRQEYDTCQIDINRLQRVFQEAKAELAGLTARVEAANEHLVAKKHELTAITQGIPASQLLAQIAQSLEMVRQEEGLAKESAERAAELLAAAEQAKARAETSWKEAEDRRKALQVRLTAKLAEEGFADVSAMAAAYMPASRQDEGRHLLKTYAETEQRLIAQYEQLLDALKGRNVTEAEWEQSKELMDQTEAGKNKATQERVEADKEYRDLSVKHQRWAELESMRLKVKGERDCLQALRTLLRGNVFVEFLAQEQMELVVRQASERLKQITQHRYALEINSDGGFLIRDDANGGVKRPVSTLSGGETFQTALALALALSAQIQLKGKYPLEFFFLDEGFGSLDQHALDVAMSTLEKLHIERLAIGIISHVSELKQRLQRRLIVDPAEPAGRGSRIRVEEA